MKILIVSNLYPPHHVGGYELRCSQVAQHIQQKGHEVRVITSTYKLPPNGTAAPQSQKDIANDVPVSRSLRYYRFDPPPTRFYALNLAKRQLEDARRFIQVLDEFQPDIVNWWNMEGLTKCILEIPSSRNIPDVFCIDDNWLIVEYGLAGENERLAWFDFWRGAWGPPILRPILRRVLAHREKATHLLGIPTRPFRNLSRHVCYVSEFLRFEHVKAGLAFPSSEVIYGGIVPGQFYVHRPAFRPEDSLGFLYAGYIDENRGLHTIIEAFGLLPRELFGKVRLSIAHNGPAQSTRYLAQVKARIKELGLSDRVNFLGKIAHKDMPQVYSDHHVLISATTRAEGLPMNMMEAMCAGCAVITTGSGGAIEIADVADLPIFPKDHPVALSRLLAKLTRNPELIFQIGKRGQDAVQRQFTFERMMDNFYNVFGALCKRDERKPELDVAQRVQ